LRRPLDLPKPWSWPNVNRARRWLGEVVELLRARAD
jgi:hypothetical protein